MALTLNITRSFSIVVMTGEVSNRRYPKEKFDTALLEQPSVQKALARIFPYLSQDGMWRCNQCGQTTNRKLSHVSVT